jgi:DNA-binding HxlR family transcriptional regulator
MSSPVSEDLENDCHDIREILNRVGDTWSLQVIAILAAEPRRFNEMRRSIEGISQRMLTRTLRFLERDGMVNRTVLETVPPSVEYELTQLGRTLIEPVTALVEWARRHRSEIRSARSKFQERSTKGRAMSHPSTEARAS